MWTSRIPASLAIALILGAAVMGGASTRWWDLRQQRHAQEAAVSLQALVPGLGVASGGVDGGNATIEASLALVNAGPAAIEVTTLHAVQDGLTVWATKAPGVIRPGVRPISVRVTLDCAAGMPTVPVRVRMQVRTADSILSPSAHDPARNPHRTTVAWSKSAVRVILRNPRYTGRQVWNGSSPTATNDRPATAPPSPR